MKKQIITILPKPVKFEVTVQPVSDKLYRRLLIAMIIAVPVILAIAAYVSTHRTSGTL